MSYIESALLPGESVITKAKIHWFIYISPVVITLIGIFLCVVSTQDTAIVGVLGVLFTIFGIFRAVKAWLFCYSTELAVTTKRVIAKYGFIRRSTVEIKHDKIESLNIDRSFDLSSFLMLVSVAGFLDLSSCLISLFIFILL